MRRWFQRQQRGRTLAVSLLILALLPTPWPKVEFHNVRHQDEAGQVCEYHDHLLRWHPDASSGGEVAVLHWHWGWPTAALGPEHDGNGPLLHAQIPADALPTAEPTPALAADASARSLVAPLFESESSIPTTAFDLLTLDPLSLRGGIPPALTFSATFAPRISLTARLHRWSC